MMQNTQKDISQRVHPRYGYFYP